MNYQLVDYGPWGIVIDFETSRDARKYAALNEDKLNRWQHVAINKHFNGFTTVWRIRAHSIKED